jgi:hypothetical protein
VPIYFTLRTQVTPNFVLVTQAFRGNSGLGRSHQRLEELLPPGPIFRSGLRAKEKKNL